MKQNILLSLFLSLFSVTVVCQQTVKGIVTDTEGEELVGATIVISGTTNGTITNIVGRFSLFIPENNNSGNLIVSYTGYTSKAIPVPSGTTDLDIELETDDRQLKDIVVTANKKLEVAQTVPLSISTLNPIALKRTGSFEAKDYFSSIPNLSVTASGGGGNVGFGDGRSSGANIAIRGVSGDKTTVMYLDDTPLPEFADPKLFDVERVEVLRGPQGTLYGSSTMGGAVKVVTKKPNAYKTEGSIDLTTAAVTEGDLDYSAQGIYNVPLSTGKAALRLGAFYNFKTGFYDRIKQTNFNGFPLNTGTGTGPNTGAGIWDHDEDPSTPSIEWTGGAREINLFETGGADRGGWQEGETIRENINDETSFGFNVGLGIYPNENISIIPKFIYQETHGNGYDFADFEPGNFTQYRIAGLDEEYNLDLLHGGVTATFKIGNGELVNSFSYNQVNQLDVEDMTERANSGPSNNQVASWLPDGGFWNPDGAINYYPEYILREGTLDKIVEELRYVSDFDSRFNFTAGLFYTTETAKFNAVQTRNEYMGGLSSNLKLIVEVAGLPEQVNENLLGLAGFIDGIDGIWYSQDTEVTTSELAFFGETYFDVTDKLRLTAGLRYFNASQDFNQLIGGFVGNGVLSEPEEVSDSGINPKFNLTFKPSSNATLYINAARGYRLGGLNPVVPVVFAGNDLEALGLEQAPTQFEPDAIWTYELGSKNTLAGGKMILNASVFRSDWDNLQQRVFLPSGFLFIDNVGKASMTGGEVELRGKLSEAIEVNGGLGFVEAVIEEGSILTGAEEGDRILNVPEVTANAGVQYTQDLNDDNGLYIRLDLQHTGERVNTFSPELDSQQQFVFDPFTILNGRVGFTTSMFEIALFGRNITNTIANYGDITSLGAVPFGRRRYQTSRPASVGLNLRYNF